MTDYILLVALTTSIILNFTLAVTLLRAKKNHKINSMELTEFIHDLTEGDALIKCTRVDGANIFLRSPRG